MCRCKKYICLFFLVNNQKLHGITDYSYSYQKLA